MRLRRATCRVPLANPRPQIGQVSDPPSGPRVHQGLLLQTRGAHAIQSESAPGRSLPPMWCGRHLLFLFLLPLLKSHSCRALAPETLLGPPCALLGEASGHSTGGSAFTASPRLPMRCQEPEVLCHPCPVDHVHFCPLHPLRPILSRTLGSFPQAFLGL